MYIGRIIICISVYTGNAYLNGIYIFNTLIKRYIVYKIICISCMQIDTCNAVGANRLFR